MRFKKTKIVATIGPASWDYKTLKLLAENGMNVARLNFSHGTHEEKGEQIRYIRKISEELGQPITIIADLQGPKMRLGSFEGIREIKKDETIRLSLNPLDDELPIQFDLSPYVKKSQRIFLNDGLIELKVLAVTGKVIKTQAQNAGVVSSHKAVNIPDTRLKGGVITDKDYSDAKFALSEKVDYLALSFIQVAEDLDPIRELIKKEKSKAQIISKMETRDATLHMEEIIKASDAIMVARGDLAVETAASEVPILQQKMTRLCRQYQKPVIIATQMLESMVENPRPTRAEASDVANAVLDQVDAVMLSAESANGKYPVETVKTMTDIIISVEENPDYKNYIKINWENILPENLAFSAIASSAAALSYHVGAKTIAVSTTTGRTVKLLASFRPGSEIIALTYDEVTRSQLNLVWGTLPVIVKPSSHFADFLKEVLSWMNKLKIAKKGDKVVVVTGSSIGATGSTDTIKLVTI